MLDCIIDSTVGSAVWGNCGRSPPTDWHSSRNFLQRGKIYCYAIVFGPNSVEVRAKFSEGGTPPPVEKSQGTV